MSQQVEIERIWWRNVPPGEFFNVERHPSVRSGGQGALYFEVPDSLVDRTLDFLGLSSLGSLPFTIHAGLADEMDSGVSGPIEFRQKTAKSKRMYIARQNRQMAGAQRHPAWDASRGFPTAPNGVRTNEEAQVQFPEGGLRIYIAKSVDGDYFAGFTKGLRPSGMDPLEPAWDLYSQGRVPGGVIEAR